LCVFQEDCFYGEVIIWVV